MPIQCPSCREVVPASQINVSADLAVCAACNESFRASSVLDATASAAALAQPPPGTWLLDEPDRVVIGASTRSPIAFFLVPFMLVWSGGSLGGIYGSQLAKGEFSLLQSLFGIPFLLGSVLFWAVALMAIAGKVEVSLGPESSVFTGIGAFGWRRRFAWSGVRTIRDEATYRSRGGRTLQIVLEGAQRISFGRGVSDQRLYYVLNALKWVRHEPRFRSRAKSWS